MTRFIFLALFGGALAGCALEPTPGMELKCQMTKCVCVRNTLRFPIRPGLDTVPIVWQDNGNASCPKDYVLREAEAKK